jgi:hypothetical protein
LGSSPLLTSYIICLSYTSNQRIISLLSLPHSQSHQFTKMWLYEECDIKWWSVYSDTGDGRWLRSSVTTDERRSQVFSITHLPSSHPCNSPFNVTGINLIRILLLVLCPSYVMIELLWLCAAMNSKAMVRVYY